MLTYQRTVISTEGGALAAEVEKSLCWVFASCLSTRSSASSASAAFSFAVAFAVASETATEPLSPEWLTK
jgi:hypothetical protein